MQNLVNDVNQNSYSTAYKNRNDYGEECMDNDFENETRETPGYPNSYGPIGTRFDHSPSVPMHDTRYPSRHCAAGDGFSRSLNANPLYSTPSPYMHDVTRQVFPWPSNADPKYSPRSGSMRAAGIRAATSSSNAHFKHSIRSDSMNKVGRQALEEPPKASALHFSPVASSDRVQPSYAYMTHQPPLSYGTQYSPVQNHPVSPSPSSSQSLLLYPTPRGAPPPQLYPCPQPPPDPGRTFRLSASSSSLNQPKKRSNIDPKAEYQLCEMDGKPYRNEESDKLAWYNISLIKVGTFHSFQYPEIYQWRYNADEKELSLKNKDQVKEGIGVVSNSVITKPWVVELMKIRNVSGSVTYQPDVRAGLVAHVLTNNCYNVAKKCSENCKFRRVQMYTQKLTEHSIRILYRMESNP